MVKKIFMLLAVFSLFAAFAACSTKKTAKKTGKEISVTISARCDTVLANMDKLNKTKRDIIPEDGIILAETTVSAREGESAFDVLLRETRRLKLHMEYVGAPLLNSAYIEGIGNLYELDAGELSGWLYRVNGEWHNYSCSEYMLQDGDIIEWLYTCDLGEDLGAEGVSQE